MKIFEIFSKFAFAAQIDLTANNRTIEKFNKSFVLEQTKEDVSLVSQNAVASKLFFLKSGKANFVKNRDLSEVLITSIKKEMVPLGISGLNSPGRYMAEIRLVKNSEYFCIELDTLWDLIHSDPFFGAKFLSFTLAKATDLLWSTRELEIPTWNKNQNCSEGLAYSIDHNIASRLGDTGFFVTLSIDRLQQLLNYSEVLLYSKNEQITIEGQGSKGVQILLSGRLRVSFTNSRGNLKRTQNRTIVRPGMVISWHNGFSQLASPYTVIATRDTSILTFSEASLQKLFQEEPELASTLMQRLLWQVGRYQQTVTGLSSYGTELETVLIRNLLNDNQPQIPVSSSLHGVPHALENRFTIGYALDCIYQALIRGNSAERSIAGLMLDFLDGVERENRFFNQLTKIYNRVAGAPKNANTSVLRELSNADFSSLFSQVPFVIKGINNLPENPENIFFYNHLAAIPENTLANGHAFSIDSHFVSAMILQKKYGDGGRRIVRTSRDTEFWRNGYYARLDNIFVHNRESDLLDETFEEKKRRKESLFASAQKTFEMGRPLAIAPEGTSETEDNKTHTSPGQLKPGAFLLAERLKPEPFLVPIALANFDKPVGKTTFSAVIKKPFRISEYVSDVREKNEMNRFLAEYRETLRGYVAEARALADEIHDGKYPIDSDLYTNVGLVSPIEQEFEVDVRELEGQLELAEQPDKNIVLYGGSSFRLWSNAKQDIGLNNLINLGFGGATVSACRIYFKRLVLKYCPKHLIIYAGDNDIGSGVKPENALNELNIFIAEIDELLPKTICYFVSVKPSPFRIPFLKNISVFNESVKNLITTRGNWKFIDLYNPMIDDSGMPSNSFYDTDPLHLNNTGYALLGKLIRDNLINKT